MLNESDIDTQSSEHSFYESIKDYEHHFNQMQFEVRKLASAWLLATFGAIAYVFRGAMSAETALLPAIPTISVICLLGAIGLFVLWVLDIVVYRGLLNAAFNMAVRIEQRNERVPPLRSMMMVNAMKTGMGRYMTWFYRAPLTALAAIPCALILYSLLTKLHSPTSLVVEAVNPNWLLLPVIVAILVVFEWISFHRMEHRKLEWFADLGMYDEFSETRHASEREWRRYATERLQQVVSTNVKRWGQQEGKRD